MRCNIRLPGHGVAHQSTNAPVAIGKWMNVVESMVGGGHGDDASGLPHPIDSVAIGEVVHEFADLLA